MLHPTSENANARLNFTLFVGWLGLVVILHLLEYGLVFFWITDQKVADVGGTSSTDHSLTRGGLQSVALFFGLSAL